MLGREKSLNYNLAWRQSDTKRLLGKKTQTKGGNKSFYEGTEGVDNTELMTNEMEKRQQLSSEGKETCHFVDANVPAIQTISTGWHCVGVRGMRACICICMRVSYLRIDLRLQNWG